MSYNDLSEENDILNSHGCTVAWESLAEISFPTLTDININMMPFRVEKGYNTIPEVTTITFILFEHIITLTGLKGIQGILAHY